MRVINFSHPLTSKQVAAIEQFTSSAVEYVIDVATHFDSGIPFAEQVKTLLEGIPFSSQEWQTIPLLVNPPSLAVIACVLLAELHGRMGYFPPVLRLRPVSGSTPPVFEVVEIINLQAVRDAARARR